VFKHTLFSLKNTMETLQVYTLYQKHTHTHTQAPGLMQCLDRDGFSYRLKQMDTRGHTCMDLYISLLLTLV
jgi:hypothetical protein